MKGMKFVTRGDQLVAVTSMKVKVTKKDILDGEIGETTSCAIALAVKRAVKKHAGCGADSAVNVSGSEITVGNFARAEGVQKRMDYMLDDFVNVFDTLDQDEGMDRKTALKTGKIKPFEFELTLENEVGEVPTLC